jgi:hypothetical protein
MTRFPIRLADHPITRSPDRRFPPPSSLLPPPPAKLFHLRRVVAYTLPRPKWTSPPRPFCWSKQEEGYEPEVSVPSQLRCGRRCCRRCDWSLCAAADHSRSKPLRGPALPGGAAVAAAAPEPLGLRLDYRRRGRRPGSRLGLPSRRRLARGGREGDGHHPADLQRVLYAGSVRSRVRYRR